MIGDTIFHVQGFFLQNNQRQITDWTKDTDFCFDLISFILDSGKQNMATCVTLYLGPENLWLFLCRRLETFRMIVWGCHSDNDSAASSFPNTQSLWMSLRIRQLNQILFIGNYGYCHVNHAWSDRFTHQRKSWFVSPNLRCLCHIYILVTWGRTHC